MVTIHISSNARLKIDLATLVAFELVYMQYYYVG